MAKSDKQINWKNEYNSLLAKYRIVVNQVKDSQMKQKHAEDSLDSYKYAYERLLQESFKGE